MKPVFQAMVLGSYEAFVIFTVEIWTLLNRFETKFLFHFPTDVTPWFLYLATKLSLVYVSREDWWKTKAIMFTHYSFLCWHFGHKKISLCKLQQVNCCYSLFVVRFFQWIFSKLESSITDEVKIPLLLSLGKVNLKILASIAIDWIRFYSLNSV